VAGVVGVTIVAGGLAYASYRHRSVDVVNKTAPPMQKQLGSKSGKDIDVRRVGLTKTASNWKVAGKPFKTSKPKKVVRRRKRLNYVEWEKLRLQKENTKQKRNSKARRKYWRSKPVGGGPASIRRKKT
jgi:hypothetical protein